MEKKREIKESQYLETIGLLEVIIRVFVCLFNDSVYFQFKKKQKKLKEKDEYLNKLNVDIQSYEEQYNTELGGLKNKVKGKNFNCRIRLKILLNEQPPLSKNIKIKFVSYIHDRSLYIK